MPFRKQQEQSKRYAIGKTSVKIADRRFACAADLGARSSAAINQKPLFQAFFDCCLTISSVFQLFFTACNNLSQKQEWIIS
ncbi:MAG: hypothetical protein LBQ52_10725 [Helicobacteraceae bacterium]|nr:hypothetical protein [Helicobacteraceae bacterium]